MTTLCDDVITNVLESVSGDWTCQPLDDGWLQVTTPHQYSDGDHVELLVRRDADSVVVSDGGEALARLDLAGVSVDNGRARNMWRRLLRAHALEARNERLSVHGNLDETGRLVEEMASAVANIDGLRLLAVPPRSPRFSESLVTFLQAEFEFVTEGPQLTGRSSTPYRATAAVGNPDRQTFVQAVSGNNNQTRQRAIEHAFTMFSDVNGSLSAERKLVVLNEGEWRAEQTRLLATVAYVGSWSYREHLVQFIHNPDQARSRTLMPSQAEVI
jgi:hypothetical protein